MQELSSINSFFPGVSVTVAPLSWRSVPCAGTPSRLSTDWYSNSSTCLHIRPPIFWHIHTELQLFSCITKFTFIRWLVTPGRALSLPHLSHRPVPLLLWWKPHLSCPSNPRNLLSFSLLTLENPLTPRLKTLHISLLCEAECQHLSDFYCCFVTLYNLNLYSTRCVKPQPC